MKEYFKLANTVQKIKVIYRELAVKFHPDLGGSEALMKELNNVYHALLKEKHNTTYKNTEGTTSTYYYNPKTEEAISVKLRELLGLRLPDDVTIELIGTWIWVSGNTKPHSKLLGKNGAGLWFNRKRQVWNFHVKSGKKFFSSNKSMEEIKSTYGSVSNFQVNNQIG